MLTSRAFLKGTSEAPTADCGDPLRLNRRPRHLAFGAEVIHKYLDVVGLEDAAKRRHSSATVADLSLNAVLLPAPADGGEIGAAVRADTIDAMAVLAALVVEDGGTGGAALLRKGVGGRGEPRGDKRSKEEGCDQGGRRKAKYAAREGRVAVLRKMRGFFPFDELRIRVTAV